MEWAEKSRGTRWSCPMGTSEGARIDKVSIMEIRDIHAACNHGLLCVELSKLVWTESLDMTGVQLALARSQGPCLML